MISRYRLVMCLCTVRASRGSMATRWQKAIVLSSSCVGGYDMADEAPLLGLLGLEHVPGEEKLLGGCRSDLDRQHAEGHKDPVATRRRVAEHGAVSREHDVTRADQIEGAGEAVVVHLGDDRLAVVPHAQPPLRHHPQPFPVAGDVRLALPGQGVIAPALPVPRS